MYARWDLGTFKHFPNMILGEHGQLMTHHNQITKLSLIRRPDCEAGIMPLWVYSNLRELTFNGIKEECEFATLKACFDRHHEQLEALDLDFDWSETEEHYELADIFTSEGEDDFENYMPKLRKLSLSSASFNDVWDDTWVVYINAFNLQRVAELRILNCRYTAEMLNYMAQISLPLQAKKVELALRCPYAGVENHSIDILAPFICLKDLFVMLEAAFNDRFYLESILRHQNTLQRLVYHRRNYEMHDGDSPYFEEWFDVSSIDEREGRLAHLLRQNKLECLGVCTEPSKLQKNLQSVAPSVKSLRLLHLRFTGKRCRAPRFYKGIDSAARSEGETEYGSSWDYYDEDEKWQKEEKEELEAFAEWAFGPSGFPRLQVLASGDFAHGNLFAGSRTLWCRRSHASTTEAKWRAVQPEDVALQELIDANMDMLSACPVGSLYDILEAGPVVDLPWATSARAR